MSESGLANAPLNEILPRLQKLVEQTRDAVSMSLSLSLQPSNHEQLDKDWPLVIGALHQLQKRLEGDPRIISFNFSRDNSEVSVKVKDSSKLGFSYFVLSRSHPSDRNASKDRVWLYDLSGKEESYEQPVEAMNQLGREVISRLA